MVQGTPPGGPPTHPPPTCSEGSRSPQPRRRRTHGTCTWRTCTCGAQTDTRAPRLLTYSGSWTSVPRCSSQLVADDSRRRESADYERRNPCGGRGSPLVTYFKNLSERSVPAMRRLGGAGAAGHRTDSTPGTVPATPATPAGLRVSIQGRELRQQAFRLQPPRRVKLPYFRPPCTATSVTPPLYGP